MLKKYADKDYYYIVNNILNNNEFRKIDNCSHHGISRLEHCVRVSYYSYLITKYLGLDYEKTARAALLHDFFIGDNSSKLKSFFNHSKIALENSDNLFILSDKERDIINTHMFPVNINKIPKYMESWVVSFVDKASCIYEGSLTVSRCFKFKLQNAMVISIFLIGRFL